MKCMLLTKRNGNSILVNMSLVSEGSFCELNEDSFTRLVVPSAIESDDRFIDVKETPEEIFQKLAAIL
jgi:hypothetical protein